jgi:transposase-like protein
MARKHKSEDIIGKLREAEIVLAQGGTVADACRWFGVTEQSYYRWRKEYGGLKIVRQYYGLSAALTRRTQQDR